MLVFCTCYCPAVIFYILIFAVICSLSFSTSLTSSKWIYYSTATNLLIHSCQISCLPWAAQRSYSLELSALYFIFKMCNLTKYMFVAKLPSTSCLVDWQPYKILLLAILCQKLYTPFIIIQSCAHQTWTGILTWI